MSLLDLGPYRLPSGDIALEPAVREAMVGELYTRSAASLLGLIPVLFLLKSILGSAWDVVPGIKGIFAALACVVAIRLGLVFKLRMNPGRLSAKNRGLIFSAGAILIAICFAIMNAQAWDALSVGQIGLLIIIHAGVNSVSLISMSPGVWAYLIYMGVDMGSLFFLVGFRGGIPGYDNQLLMMLVIYMAALAFMSIQSHRILGDRILAHLKLEELALHDTLTGLRNRRFLLDFMGPESSRILRSWGDPNPPHQSFTILLLDLDHFKLVNDTHGHAAGDAVLQQLSDALTDMMRRHDLVIRWGGEEFLIVARGTDRSHAIILADRIRERVEGLEFLLPDGTRIQKSCSIGYALLPFSPQHPDLLTWEQVLTLADTALYRAKELGRNRAIGVFEGARAWDLDDASILGKVLENPAKAEEMGYMRFAGELPVNPVSA